jgi:hypothetical protein
VSGALAAPLEIGSIADRGGWFVERSLSLPLLDAFHESKVVPNLALVAARCPITHAPEKISLLQRDSAPVL